MTVAVDISPKPVTALAVNPRKRKKRAPAAGAAADCFKCAERNLHCDRRRPFCSQCLDAGEDCSGYKTQLTWGVGVASRGKLRGLALPIAGTRKTIKEEVQQKPKKRRSSSIDQFSNLRSSTEAVPEQRLILPDIASAQTTVSGADDFSTSTVGSIQAPIWDPTFFSAPHDYYQTQMFPDIRQAETTSSNTYSENSMQTSGYPHMAQNVFTDQQSPSPTYYDSTGVNALNTFSSLPEFSFLDRSGSMSAASDLVSPAQLTFPELPLTYAPKNGDRKFDGISLLLEAGQSMQLPTNEELNIDEEVKREDYDDCAVSDDLSTASMAHPFYVHLPRPVFSNIGKTARMQYLINYYAEVISPVIVAFDSPSNPFRTQILRLAERSETLQHAISALAASNLRQRRGIGLLSTGKTAPARRSSFAHVSLTNDYSQNMLSFEDQMREEILHKRLAVAQLNQQLGHPVLRRDDSILATLLMLCLFHMCDSGVAKFQTQFAGVRKLLAFRGDDLKVGSEDSRWISRLFTWYDALAATVNNRERQISGQFLDMSVLCGNWALENLAGIDGQLFKSISRLGRLNLLHQGKEVNPVSTHNSRAPSSLPSEMYASLDGNGWMPTIPEHEVSFHRLGESRDEQFWQEWRDIRHELLSWNLDTTLFDSLSTESMNLTVEQRLDLENISQSFRYSALIYIERLANPTAPSSDEAIQQWVRQSLKHIREVISDVYLLWPLFITGTECIDDEGRSVIRGRCADIQKDSGFVNNASCLQLLEKIWRMNSPHSSPQSDEESLMSSCSSLEHANGSAFKFRDVMLREAARTEGEGEYIVV